MDGYQALANAIVTMAAKDYRSALRHLKRYPDSESAVSAKRELEAFFHSEWYSLLTTVDCNLILNRIREEEAE